MSHLEKLDTIIHVIIESSAPGCDAIFSRAAFMFDFAAGSGALNKGKRDFL